LVELDPGQEICVKPKWNCVGLVTGTWIPSARDYYWSPSSTCWRAVVSTCESIFRLLRLRSHAAYEPVEMARHGSKHRNTCRTHYRPGATLLCTYLRLPLPQEIVILLSSYRLGSVSKRRRCRRHAHRRIFEHTSNQAQITLFEMKQVTTTNQTEATTRSISTSKRTAHKL